MPIHGFMKSADQFPIQKCAVFASSRKSAARGGGFLSLAAQVFPLTCQTFGNVTRHALGVVDADMVEKGPLWTETRRVTTAFRSIFTGIFGVRIKGAA
ncbi:MAG: hypothetical protein WBM78_14565 [Desulfobacterales bacterium]